MDANNRNENNIYIYIYRGLSLSMHAAGLRLGPAKDFEENEEGGYKVRPGSIAM